MRDIHGKRIYLIKDAYKDALLGIYSAWLPLLIIGVLYGGFTALPTYETFKEIGFLFLDLPMVIDGFAYSLFLLLVSYISLKYIAPSLLDGVEGPVLSIKKYFQYLPWVIYMKALLLVLSIVSVAFVLLIQLELFDYNIWENFAGFSIYVVEFWLYLRYIYLANEIIIKDNFHVNPVSESKRYMKREKAFLASLLLLPFLVEKGVGGILPSDFYSTYMGSFIIGILLSLRLILGQFLAGALYYQLKLNDTQEAIKF